MADIYGESSKTALENLKKMMEVDSDTVALEENSALAEVSNCKPSNSGYVYEIGDIVWAKIVGYPYWPSIVCLDPETNTIMKKTGKTSRMSIHVRFFNDCARRSWTKNVELYSGEKSILAKYPKFLSFYKNDAKGKKAWDLAVKEADDFLEYIRKERISQFYDKYKLPLTSVSNNTTLIDKDNTSRGKKVGGRKKKSAGERKRKQEEESSTTYLLDAYDDDDDDDEDEDEDEIGRPPEILIPTSIISRLVPSLRKIEISHLEELKPFPEPPEEKPVKGNRKKKKKTCSKA